MLGVVILLVLMVLVTPPLLFVGGALVSAIMGWSLKNEGEDTHEGSELIDLNR